MKNLLMSFVYAFRGLRIGIQNERNMKVHLLAVAVVTVAGILGGIEPWAWAALSLCFGLVIALELMNTGLERLCDRVVGAAHEEIIRNIKDMSAAAVLVGALASVGVAAAVFCRAEVLARILSIFG